MTYVRMMVALWSKAKNVAPGIKHPPVEWEGEDQIEAYTTSEGGLVLEIHRDKVKIDDAKRRLPVLEREVVYNTNQVTKINAEIADGRMGRKGDLSKFEAEVSRLREEIRVTNDLIQNAIVDRVEFMVEDCE